MYASDEDTDPVEDEDLLSDGLPDEPDHSSYIQNAKYPRETHLVPLKAGCRNIALKEQSPEIKEVFAEAVLLAQRDFLFKNPFPSTALNYKYDRRLFHTAAVNMHRTTIAARAENDVEFGVLVGRVVRGISCLAGASNSGSRSINARLTIAAISRSLHTIMSRPSSV